MWKEYRAIKLLSLSYAQSLMGLLLQQGELISDTFGED